MTVIPRLVQVNQEVNVMHIYKLCSLSELTLPFLSKGIIAIFSHPLLVHSIHNPDCSLESANLFL